MAKQKVALSELFTKEHPWKERKRNIFGLPWSFTVYECTDEALLIHSGVLKKVHQEVLLYRIKDKTVTESLVQRIFGLGTIHFDTTDTTTPQVHLVNVRGANEVKAQMSEAIETCRIKKGYTVRELMSSNADGEEDVHEDLM